MRMENTATPFSGLRDGWGRFEAWMDGIGFPAWLAAMVLGFVIFFPIGLGLLFFMLWSGRMGGRHWGARRGGCGRRGRMRGTGNSAFDAYREETLKRLDEERDAFVAFVDRLRQAKDQAEFDQFLDERRRAGGAGGEPSGQPQQGPQPY